ncbi:uncharacterized protein PAE49_012006 [Odontesthes bonariensis]|uniref:uncharacterized protein LOC142391406 n=1 Tax=Odontesthes bonariensis TaxID=219752 RepID=UPI003F586026
MKVCWMFVIFLYYMSSYSAQCLSPNSSNETTTYCAPRQGHVPVFVPCPTKKGDVTFKLFKNQDLIWSVQESLLRGLNPQLQINEEDNLTGFNLNGASNTTYKCEAAITFPPPYSKIDGPKIQVLVEGEDCTCEPTCNTKEESRNKEDIPERTPWIWITVVVLLSTYSLTATIVASVLWFKLQGADSQSDYINTKPIAPRNRKKKKTVQNPAPRYF